MQCARIAGGPARSSGSLPGVGIQKASEKDHFPEGVTRLYSKSNIYVTFLSSGPNRFFNMPEQIEVLPKHHPLPHLLPFSPLLMRLVADKRIEGPFLLQILIRSKHQSPSAKICGKFFLRATLLQRSFAPKNGASGYRLQAPGRTERGLTPAKRLYFGCGTMRR